ncbi:MAG: V-type ATP synthase subunit D [Candidatus Micrarchaeota archaeon]|nr:V-type ATP synthase subunit D [Candidatus Micrarchaeota archaeon]
MARKTNVKTTRIELINAKRRIKTAQKGLDLLKLKRASLVLEFFNFARQIKALRANLATGVDRAMASTEISNIAVGRVTLERIAAEQSTMMVGVAAKNVMGVRIPNLSFKEQAEASLAYELVSLPTSVEDARRSYRNLFTLLIEIAEKENSLRRLLYEIEKLNRRSNAIENVVIPGLREKAAYIKQRLDDIERDQIISLKFIKRKMNG